MTFTATPEMVPVERRRTTATGTTEPASQDAGLTDMQAPVANNETASHHRVKVRGEFRDVELRQVLSGYARIEDYKTATEDIARQRDMLATGQVRNLSSDFADLSFTQDNSGDEDMEERNDPNFAGANQFNGDERHYLSAMGYGPADYAMQIGPRERRLLSYALGYRQHFDRRQQAARAAKTEQSVLVQRRAEASNRLVTLKERALKGGLDEQTDFFLAIMRQE